MKSLILFFLVTSYAPVAIGYEMYRFNVSDKDTCETDLECCTAYGDCGVEGLE